MATCPSCCYPASTGRTVCPECGLSWDVALKRRRRKERWVGQLLLLLCGLAFGLVFFANSEIGSSGPIWLMAYWQSFADSPYRSTPSPAGGAVMAALGAYVCCLGLGFFLLGPRWRVPLSTSAIGSLLAAVLVGVSAWGRWDSGPAFVSGRDWREAGLTYRTLIPFAVISTATVAWCVSIARR